MIPEPIKAMGAYRQFLLYRIVDGMKYPFDYNTNRVVDAHDPKYWTDYDTAFTIAACYGVDYGVAFVFTEDDPFFFVDIDDCLVNGQWSQLALTICGIFKGSAVEISRSGTGLHIFGSYGGNMLPHGCKANGIEFYHSKRFVALTGTSMIGNCSKDFTQVLPEFIRLWVPDDGITNEGSWTTEACEEYGTGLEEDEVLINKALNIRNAANAFGAKCSFSDLWNADEAALSKFYPDNYGGNRAYDYSQADAALAQHLAFWTGKNCERIERLMWKSALVRDKWEKHKSYIQRTILGAVRRCTEVYSVNKTQNLLKLTDNDKGDIKYKGESVFCTPDQQVELFKGCTYIRDIHKIMIPGGAQLKPEQFKTHFGGRRYILDAANSKIVDDAWLAFTQNQVYSFPHVEAPAFKPSIPSGQVFEHSGKLFVNTYYPQEVKRKKGDISPFMKHLELLLPNERDRTILLSYMASCVQHIGIKFQWAPLLQGVEGNGKTLLTRCVAEAIGTRYVHWPKASKLGKEFNAWMLGKLLYGVEDVYSPKSKYEIWEDLKPMITGGFGLEIEGKGVDQISADICGNFMFNSNHKDGLPKTNNDRRLCMLFTAQQAADDLIRDGMTGDYFPKLYDWCNEGGFAIVTDYLYSYNIPEEFNPAGKCQRAPETSTTREAINAGRSSIEQEVMEAIETEKPGFAGDFISMVMFERLLTDIGGKRLSINKKHQIIENLGYVLHPALPGGRTPSIVMPDAARTKLFIRKQSDKIYLCDINQVIAIYIKHNSA